MVCPGIPHSSGKVAAEPGVRGIEFPSLSLWGLRVFLLPPALGLKLAILSRNYLPRTGGGQAGIFFPDEYKCFFSICL